MYEGARRKRIMTLWYHYNSPVISVTITHSLSQAIKRYLFTRFKTKSCIYGIHPAALVTLIHIDKIGIRFCLVWFCHGYIMNHLYKFSIKSPHIFSQILQDWFDGAGEVTLKDVDKIDQYPTTTGREPCQDWFEVCALPMIDGITL